MMTNESDFIEYVADAVGDQDFKSLSSIVSDFSSFVFKQESEEQSEMWSADFTDALLGIMERAEFLEWRNSFPLLMLFQSDWGRLTSADRIRVCHRLEQSYDKIRDHASHLVIVELLGEYLADRNALEALDRLSSVDDHVARAHVARGYGLLIKSTPDAAVIDDAMMALRRMTSDPSEVVSREAANVLSGIPMQ